jgi:glycosyltransferase involved in cell wall biosynthesis
LKITANIITLNEEKNIEEVIKSVQSVCDEVLVVDSLSSDRTCEIAESLGAKVE